MTCPPRIRARGAARSMWIPARWPISSRDLRGVDGHVHQHAYRSLCLLAFRRRKEVSASDAPELRAQPLAGTATLRGRQRRARSASTRTAAYSPARATANSPASRRSWTGLVGSASHTPACPPASRTSWATHSRIAAPEPPASPTRSSSLPAEDEGKMIFSNAG